MRVFASTPPHTNRSLLIHPRADSIVNAYLTECAEEKSPSKRSQRGLVAHTQTNYFAPISYPTVVELGLRVNHLGKSSARYEIGVFDQAESAVKAVCELTHVFVDRETGRSSAKGMDGSVREGLERILVGKMPTKL